jgi:hypothetical protein
MPAVFALLDLWSQALAVERLLEGWTDAEKLAWLSEHGKLKGVLNEPSDCRPVYLFESTVNLRCLFFFVGDKFVFLGDHTTYTVKE